MSCAKQDSEGPRQGHTCLGHEHALQDRQADLIELVVVQSIGSAMSGMKVGDSPVTSPRDGDTAFSSAHESLPTPSLSSFHESNLFSVPSKALMTP